MVPSGHENPLVDRGLLLIKRPITQLCGTGHTAVALASRLHACAGACCANGDQIGRADSAFERGVRVGDRGAGIALRSETSTAALHVNPPLQPHPPLQRPQGDPSPTRSSGRVGCSIRARGFAVRLCAPHTTGRQAAALRTAWRHCPACCQPCRPLGPLCTRHTAAFTRRVERCALRCERRGGAAVQIPVPMHSRRAPTHACKGCRPRNAGGGWRGARRAARGAHGGDGGGDRETELLLHAAAERCGGPSSA